MGTLLNLTKEYFGSGKREEEYTPEERMSRDIDNFIDKWVEENNVQFIDTGELYGRKDDEKTKIEVANMDFLAKSDEDWDIDYTPIKPLLLNSFDLSKTSDDFHTRLMFTGDESHDLHRLLNLSKKYQMIHIGWLTDIFIKRHSSDKVDFETVVADKDKTIIQCKLFGTTPIKLLAGIKVKYDYCDIHYYGNCYTINHTLAITSVDAKARKEGYFSFYNNSNFHHKIDNRSRFRLCKRYSKDNY